MMKYTILLIVCSLFIACTTRKVEQNLTTPFSIKTHNSHYVVGDTITYTVNTGTNGPVSIMSTGSCSDSPVIRLVLASDTSNIMFKQLACGRGMAILANGVYKYLIPKLYPQNQEYQLVYFGRGFKQLRSNKFFIRDID